MVERPSEVLRSQGTRDAASTTGILKNPRSRNWRTLSGRAPDRSRCDAGFHHGLLVEHQVAENARGIDGLREAVVKGFEAMDRRFEAIDRRFDAIDQRFDAIDRRFETIDRRFETIDRRFETSDQRFGAINQTMDRRFEAMDQKLSRQFFWLVGTLVVILLTILTR